MEITAIRTAATTAAAAKHLARKNSNVVTICGCGKQGRTQLIALQQVLPISGAYAYDQDECTMKDFAAETTLELGIHVSPVRRLEEATLGSDVIVTCTTARKFFLRKEHVRPGTFIAAVGADSPEKQEVQPQLLKSGKVVVDLLQQCLRMGDLHHAVSENVMHPDEVYAELGEIVSGRKPGRGSEEEIFVFDSTGSALQDVAAAAFVYERAVQSGVGLRFHLLT
jgi:ornithine cyclodeaminase/alanine dehydrogenase